MGKFVMMKRTNGEFQFNLKSNNGLVILSSEGYDTKANCEKGIELVKRYSQDLSQFDKYVFTNQKYYFNLKAANGEVIGTSQMYGTDFGVEKGILSVKTNAADAKTEDKTSNRMLRLASNV